MWLVLKASGFRRAAKSSDRHIQKRLVAATLKIFIATETARIFEVIESANASRSHVRKCQLSALPVKPAFTVLVELFFTFARLSFPVPSLFIR